MQPSGRIAIVTGAASGIGRAVCLQLAREGSNVAAVDLNAEGCADTARAVTELGRQSLAFTVDVSKRDQVKAMVQDVKAQWERIDILVTCAGIFPRSTIVELDESEWNRVIGAQLNGTFFCCQAVLPIMMEQRSGRIVITASGLAVYPMKGAAAYSAAKGGTISFARVLAKEAEPYGITVNAYGPGTTDTPMVRNQSTPEEMAEHHRTAPFGRLPTAEQSAELAVWFTRPETAHITGRVFLQ